jgi:hypothetical protein
MKTRYKVNTAGELKNGTVMLSGIVDGPLLEVGQKATIWLGNDAVSIDVVGVGVVDPNLGKDRQGILVKMLNGTGSQLKNVTISFE